MDVKFNDVRIQYLRLKKSIDSAVSTVLYSGKYILDDKVREFEAEFARFCGTLYCIGVGSGTEALYLGLMALGIGAGDEVITVSNTVIATVVPIVQIGAVPVFVDIDYDNLTLDPHNIEAKITNKTKAVLPVHLYGNPAKMDEIMAIAKKYSLKVIEDSCQAHGSLSKGKMCGSFGDIGCFSFYPTKNLGGYGDGGAILTNSKKIYNKLKALRAYGTRDGVNYEMIGLNSRLDEIQAAILLAKILNLNEDNNKRRIIANIYGETINSKEVLLPKEYDCNKHNFHLYIIKAKRRDTLKSYLQKRGIATMIHYPKPIHLQQACRFLGYKRGSLPITESTSKQILSLPIYPDMPINHALYVANEINKFYK